MKKRGKRMGRIIAVANQKGGVGKTTTAVNLAACLAVAEQQTLLVDMDPQANATSGCGVEPREVEAANVYHALLGHQSARDVVRPTQISHLSLVPSHMNLTVAEVEMVRPDRSRTEAADRARRAAAGLLLHHPRLPAIPGAADAQLPDRRPLGAHPDSVRVLRARRARQAAKHHPAGFSATSTRDFRSPASC